MFSVAAVERLYIKGVGYPRKVGYPYLISFNNLEDFKNKDIFLDNDFKYINFKNNNRTIDCLNENNCVNILNRLVINKIINLDLGAFQINYRWHKYNFENYFDLVRNYNDACKLIEYHVDRNKDIDIDNYSLIARYHSYTKEYNEKYALLLEKKMEKYYSKN
jgi:hypothetical protein